ncbi:MAG: hypothetical protein PHF30_02035, partial [Bacilli bacterium]|nr:hypothetical protein [Bacilli bacterium]
NKSTVRDLLYLHEYNKSKKLKKGMILTMTKISHNWIIQENMNHGKMLKKIFIDSPSLYEELININNKL